MTYKGIPQINPLPGSFTGDPIGHSWSPYWHHCNASTCWLNANPENKGQLTAIIFICVGHNIYYIPRLRHIDAIWIYVSEPEYVANSWYLDEQHIDTICITPSKVTK